jgi:hypothetical protein
MALGGGTAMRQREPDPRVKPEDAVTDHRRGTGPERSAYFAWIRLRFSVFRRQPSGSL